MIENKITYNNIFFPFTDVYRLGGSKVFQELSANEGKKNLIVLPISLVERLEDNRDLPSKEREYMGGGANDTLSYLKNLPFSNLNSKEGLALSSISSTLDVLIVDKNLWDQDSSIIKLEQLIRENFESETNPILLSIKPSSHLKYKSRGLNIEDPKFLLHGPDIVNEGILEGNDELYSKLQQSGSLLPLEEVTEMLGRELYNHQFIQFGANEFARVEGKYIRNKSGSRIIDLRDSQLRLLPEKEKNKEIRLGNSKMNSVLGIQPLDMVQYLALQYGVMDPAVELLFISGGAGSGKTVLAYAGIDLVLLYDQIEAERRKTPNARRSFYDKIVLLKPFNIMGGKGRDVGFLPGDLFQKIKDHLKPYEDAHKLTTFTNGKSVYIPFEHMFLHPKDDTNFPKKRPEETNRCKINGVAHLPNHEVIELTYSGFLRGRSFHNTLMLVDEAQNFSPYEMKTILSRLGPGCKCIVMGDPYDQSDNPLCTPEINGFTHAIKEFLPEPFSALIRLNTSYRSQMAEVADKWKSTYNR